MLIRIPHSNPTISHREAKAVYDAILSGNLAQGSLVEKFEKKFSQFQKIKYSAATNSGTSALHLALRALKIKKGDEVIMPSFVCTALLNAIYYVGAKPKVVDVDKDDFNISVHDVKRNLTLKTKAMIIPHMFGQTADLSPLLKLDVPIIEDCAHSIGAQYKGKPSGSFGVLSVYSFYATKMMTTGEGGMVASNDSSLINQIKDWRDYDHKLSYEIRFNYKMTDLQAAMGITQLSQLPLWIKKRKKIARCYQHGLAKCDLILPIVKPDRDHIFYRFIVKIKRNKSRFMSTLREKGIACAAPIFCPIHRYLNLNGFPVTEGLIKEAVSIPIYPSLTDNHCKKIIKCIQLTFKEGDTGPFSPKPRLAYPA